ncbi:DUF1638 domain-containing protein [Thermosipho atlanticus]|uniref:DUF1638 domain-containing protein n=1 Tax=Thermosipho atlanticus DSM 15807 TaxID=1123380 RepID=A0A1M5TUS2_9BACT|nr:DUF1638 domain-containing protein [Thermosipho atlanticus]SHH54438.1 Protein of unknown function [Thermosipho atlanticus DSM 15807]
MDDKIKLFVCENFEKEFKNVAKTQKENLNIYSFPSYCTSLKLDKQEKFIKDNLENLKNSICICGRFCELLNKIPEKIKKNMKIYQLDNCFYIFGKNKVNKYLNENSFIVTPEWLEKWKEIMSNYGFDKKTARKFFNESFKKIVLFDTKINDKIIDQLIDFSNFVSLPYNIEEIELDFLEIFVSKILNEFKLKQELEKKEKKIKELNSEKSNYIAAMHMIKEFSTIESSEEIIKGIINELKILFAPKQIQYVKYDGKDFLNGKKF